VHFGRATFSGGEVYLNGATFSGGEVSFRSAAFSGGLVNFGSATFSGGEVSFRNPRGWVPPPAFDRAFDESGPPPGVTLPS